MKTLSAILPDALYAEMEPLIRPLVRALNEWGIATIGSCDGHLTASPHPWVIIDYKNTNPSALVHFIDLLAEHNQKHSGTLLEWELLPQFAKMYDNAGLFLSLHPGKRNPEHYAFHLSVMQDGIQKLVEHLCAARVVFESRPSRDGSFISASVQCSCSVSVPRLFLSANIRV